MSATWHRKTYTMVARIIKSTGSTVTERTVYAQKFRRIFKADNPNFDSLRFFQACGVGKVAKKRSFKKPVKRRKPKSWSFF